MLREMHNLHTGPQLTEGVLAQRQTVKTLETLFLLESLHVSLHSQVRDQQGAGRRT